ncbi:MAG: tetratricopeptide repeat protein [Candidatus Omnitrophica bacterium]|nr:tetratricopeptide repeat protein [Candidatus Omnitrophota bacterium]
MKKIRKTRVIGVMFCLCLVLLTSGCSEQYKMERMVWHADQAAKPIFINEGSVPSYEFKRVMDMYRKIIDAKPDSGFALDAKFKIAKLYISNQEFDQARLEYDQVLEKYKDNPELSANTVFLKALSYEQEKEWSEALKMFDLIIKQYPETSQSLSVPMYIANYYMKNEDTVSAVQAYKTAIDYYQEIADRYPNSKAGLLCENMIVRAYMEMSSWNDALNYMQSLDSKYKLGPDTLMVMAQIYKEKLNDPVKMRAIYNRILEEFPDHKVAKYVKQLMEQEKE